MFKKSNNDLTSDFYTAIPERMIDWEKNNEKNVAILLVPRFRRGPLKKWLQPRLKSPFMRVMLDDIGTLVWEMCDGKNTVGEIGKILAENFGARVQPVENRLKFFFSTLYRSDFVRFWQRDSLDQSSANS